ncbi:hypothetical protein RHSIM_Rhsim10G0084000 [Rhododendron simsii]|uniref:MADS-box domain-containing protein n=1 Tax=Rhododendron simsii TaxID=118357 RepID=A0A834LC00_RHOSS|nr:hypothetical protein RHSIM_Rhsim10G0084000 [Rhododendron simsii]
MARKISRGRQKIEMKFIESKQARQVTFSKRRSGLFKKASELCTLTGCELALVVFSPSGKPLSFGHNCVDTIFQRFLCQSPMEVTGDLDPRGSICSTIHQQYTELCKQLEEEKLRFKELEIEGLKCPKPSWFDTPTDELNLDQLEESINPPANHVGAIDLNVAPPEEMRNVTSHFLDWWPEDESKLRHFTLQRSSCLEPVQRRDSECSPSAMCGSPVNFMKLNPSALKIRFRPCRYMELLMDTSLGVASDVAVSLLHLGEMFQKMSDVESTIKTLSKYASSW